MRFSSFRSRWTMPLLWRYAIPLRTCAGCVRGERPQREVNLRQKKVDSTAEREAARARLARLLEGDAGVALGVVSEVGYRLVGKRSRVRHT